MLNIEHSDNKTVYELNLAGVNQITKSFLSEQVASAGQHFLIGNFDNLTFNAEQDGAHSFRVTIEYFAPGAAPEAETPVKKTRKPKAEEKTDIDALADAVTEG